MIYVCVPSHNEARTVGLLLWKVRQVFTEFPRDYRIVVVDDGSSDATAEVLEPYARVLPLTVIRHEHRQGYARSVEAALRLALQQTDRPKRDCAIILHADFAYSPEDLPELVRMIEGGVDLVVAQGATPPATDWKARLAQRLAAWLLRRRVGIAGLDDPASGFVAIRLVSLRNAMRAAGERFLATDGPIANAELAGRVARFARRVEMVRVSSRPARRVREGRASHADLLRSVWREGRRLRFPAPPPREERAAAAEREREVAAT